MARLREVALRWACASIWQGRLPGPPAVNSATACQLFPGASFSSPSYCREVGLRDRAPEALSRQPVSSRKSRRKERRQEKGTRDTIPPWPRAHCSVAADLDTHDLSSVSSRPGAGLGQSAGQVRRARARDGSAEATFHRLSRRLGSGPQARVMPCAYFCIVDKRARWRYPAMLVAAQRAPPRRHIGRGRVTRGKRARSGSAPFNIYS